MALSSLDAEAQSGNNLEDLLSTYFVISAECMGKMMPEMKCANHFFHMKCQLFVKVKLFVPD